MFQNLKKFIKASIGDFAEIAFQKGIPLDPQQFYERIGLLEHPFTRQPVPKLAPYQKSVWKDSFRYKYRLVIKSQKIGITTAALMEDFQKAILPPTHPLSCMGREILIIAQTHKMAKEHIDTLYNMIILSEFNKYIIERPIEFRVGRTRHRTKADMLLIHNPYKRHKPTRIIALGPRASGVWSWKNVKHIHMSDVAAIDQVDDTQFFGATFSRLANTKGTMLIETPPRGQRGFIWELYKKAELKSDEHHEAAKFKVTKIPAREAVAAGVIDEEFLEQERERIGVLYPQFYECEFVNPMQSWYEESMFKHDDDLADQVGT